MAFLVAHRGRAVGGEEDRAVEVDHVAELPEHERRRRGQARAAHVAHHHPLAKLARAPGHQQAFGEAAALVELDVRSEEHTSELQSLMRISYAVFCLKKQKTPHSTQKKTEQAQQCR